MSESEPPDRLTRLAERLSKARGTGRDGTSPANSDDPALQQGIAVGLRIGVELVVAIVVATLLGWAIDRWLGTSPWAMIVLFFLGIAAGMLNVYRAVAGIKTPVGFRRPGEAGTGIPGGAENRPGSERRDRKWDDEE